MATAKKPGEMTRAELIDEVSRLRRQLSTHPPRPRGGRDVAVRVLSLLPPALKRNGCSLEEIVEGTGLRADDVERGHDYLDWKTFVGIMERADRRLGTEQEWRAVGHDALNVPAIRGLGLAVSELSHPVDIYNWLGRVFGPGATLVPFLACRVRQQEENGVRIELQAPEGEQIPRGVYLPVAAALEQAPTLVGHPPAEVEAATDQEGSVHFQLSLKGLGSADEALSAGVQHLAAEQMKAVQGLLRWENEVLAERLRELEGSDERRRELEALLQDTEKMSAIGRLAGAIAHDFNNHLTVILTHAELISETLPAAASPHVREVVQSAERARQLVRQLTTFSRSEPLRVEVIDAGDLLRGMERMLHTIAGERVTLHITVEDPPLLMRIDPTHFEQIVVNLVANARDALPDGGGIWVRVAGTTQPSDTAAVVESGPALELSVRDDGVGMSEETRLRAFEPFFTTKPRGVGTGIGLATVYALARQHEGSASIDSGLGEGTTVRLVFPRAQTHTSGQRPADGAWAPPQAPAKILIAEDQPSIRRLLSRLLERDGHEVLIASSAEEALGIAELHSFDLLLTDVVMPGASGLELSERLREKNPELPVLLMSGADGDRWLDERTAFVQKPFKLDQLRLAVKDLLDDTKAERAG